ncbi:MAG: tetratricopeptide repeat protein [Elainellaceae cyanobacterium]
MPLPTSDFPQSEQLRPTDAFSPLSPEIGTLPEIEAAALAHSSEASSPLAQCDRHLSRPDLSTDERAYWLCLKAQMLTHRGQCLRAIACANDVMALRSDLPDGYAYYAQAHEDLGNNAIAIEQYQQAIARLPQVVSSSKTATAQAIWLWNRLGSVHRSQGNSPEAIACYDHSLALDANHGETLSHRAAVLALTGKRKEGLRDGKTAVEIEPNSVVTHNNLGIVCLINRQHQQALAAFEQALVIQPDFNKALYNRAIALCMLGREQEAMDSIQQALAVPTHRQESWVAHAWKLLGYCQLKKGRFTDCIASCEQAQELQPELYAAALYKLASLFASGRWLKRLSKPTSRRGLMHDFGVVLGAVKFRLLAIALVLGLLLLAQGTALTFLRTVIPILFSVGIIVLIAVDLWLHKSKIRFVWQTYFKSGMLVYARAIAIVMATLTTFTLAEQIAPPFMMWGWANWVFGQPGNIIFQPFNLINQLQLESPAGILRALGQRSDLLLALLHPIRGLEIVSSGFNHGFSHAFNLGELGAFMQAPVYQGVAIAPILAHATIPLNFTTAFAVVFWVMLLLGIPFWARLEERIFRQGANTWRKIGIRSTQFGLVHLIAGIPLLGGFVLIVPGFLFACRYKYVRDRHFKRHGSPFEADTAGMMASTADHAAYNAILVTLVVVTLLLTPG